LVSLLFAIVSQLRKEFRFAPFGLSLAPCEKTAVLLTLSLATGLLLGESRRYY
jgi:hypothetical protein